MLTFIKHLAALYYVSGPRTRDQMLREVCWGV